MKALLKQRRNKINCFLLIPIFFHFFRIILISFNFPNFPINQTYIIINNSSAWQRKAFLYLLYGMFKRYLTLRLQLHFFRRHLHTASCKSTQLFFRFLQFKRTKQFSGYSLKYLEYHLVAFIAIFELNFYSKAKFEHELGKNEELLKIL